MYIYSVYGYGKMKTESSIGMVVRALANNHSVLFVQFLKDGTSSEIKYLEDKVDIITSNTDKIILPKNKTADDVVDINNFYKLVFQQINTKHYDLIVLDEILVAVDMDMVSLECLKLLLKSCEANNSDVYMTGRIRDRHIRQAITDMSDCVTDAYCIKHMFNRHCNSCSKDYPYHYTYCPDCGSELADSRECKLGRDY